MIEVRVLVSPTHLGIGGSQINAVDLAASTAALGVDVIVYGPPGPLESVIGEKGLRYIAAPGVSGPSRGASLRYVPTPSRVRALMSVVRREKIDLVHAHEYARCRDAYFGPHLLDGVPLLCTVMAMELPPLLPPSVPLIVGTASLCDESIAGHRAPVWLVEPPVDVETDTPDIDGTLFRRQHGIAVDELLVVTVSRLARDLKLDALERAMDATALLAARYPVRLAVVGDGPMRSQLETRARWLNDRIGHDVIVMTGEELDPRGAYAAADVVVGMGGSSLRAMAIGKPVIVQGLQGYSEICEPETLDHFLREGFWGHGDGSSGVDLLVGQLAGLFEATDRRSELGRFGRELAVGRFSLDRAAELHLGFYDELVRAPRSRPLAEAAALGVRGLAGDAARLNPAGLRRRRVARNERLAGGSASRALPDLP